MSWGILHCSQKVISNTLVKKVYGNIIILHPGERKNFWSMAVINILMDSIHLILLQVVLAV